MSVNPYKLNVVGDFYVEDGECMACTLPASEAPSLIAEDESDGGYHCYFKKQPSTQEEIDDAVSAIAVSCCGAVQYKGHNESIIQAIITEGCEDKIYNV